MRLYLAGLRAATHKWLYKIIAMFNISGNNAKSFFLTLVLCCLVFTGECQKRGMTFTEAAKNGNTLQHLDSIYLSGVHVDTSKAAFSRSLYDSVQHEYTVLLKKLGKYLSSQGFKWCKIR